jgi:hypothetical protein
VILHDLLDRPAQPVPRGELSHTVAGALHDDLREADWHAPETRSPEEVELCERIATRLVKTSGYRYLTRDDGVGKASAWDPRAEPGRMSLEHRITDRTRAGRIDILLVDTRAHKPTLLAIEVKLRATPAGSRNPIP